MVAFARLRWSQRRAAVKSRGSERCEGTRVRSTASPFARQVEGGPRGTRQADASPGYRPPRCPTRVPASDFEQATRASCRSLVESGRPAKRELDSQPGNRRFAARRPSMAKRRRSHAACAGKRAAPGCARPSRWLQKPTGGFPVRRKAARRSKALRAVERRYRSCGPAGSGSLGSVRGKPVRARSRSNMPPHDVNSVIQSE
jgi:hypothetical protein